MTYSVGVIVGSLSANSINKRLALALARLAPAELSLTRIEIGDLPIYSYDYDADYPAEGRALKAAIEACDAILIVTPEYNRSIPAALKNAIDWASRPWGQNSFDGKPVAVIGASIGPISSAVAQQHLRGALAFLNTAVMGQPEGFIHVPEGLILDDGEVTNESTAEFFRSYLDAFLAHTHRNVA
jgi:chromate reductase